VTVVALASVKGSPGVTTAATAIAASWPVGRKVLLVEADPFGGDLAPRYGSAVTGGLASLSAAARRTLTPEAVWEHTGELPGGLPVLFGLTNVNQAVANENAWPAIASALAGLDADVVIDAGRLLPSFGGGIRHLLAGADTVAILFAPTLESIVHLRDMLPSLAAEVRDRRLVVVPTATAGYSAAEIGGTLSVGVGPAMPDDPHAAEALANRRSVRHLERTRLLRWAADFVSGLQLTPAPDAKASSGEPANQTGAGEPAPDDRATDLDSRAEAQTIEPAPVGASVEVSG
jgi:hypothetical protein